MEFTVSIGGLFAHAGGLVARRFSSNAFAEVFGMAAGALVGELFSRIVVRERSSEAVTRDNGAGAVDIDDESP